MTTVNVTAQPMTKAAAYFESLKAETWIQQLMAADFAAISTYVDNNITTIAAQRALDKKMLALLSYLLNKDALV